MTEPLILSSVLPRLRTPLSLPSWRSPSLKVRMSNSFEIYSSLALHQGIRNSYLVLTLLTCLSWSIAPWSLLGALLWLRGSLSGLWLHRLWSVPHGVLLDPEQGAHAVWKDHRAAARHPVLQRSQRGQDGPHQPGRRLLYRHDPVNGSVRILFSAHRELWDTGWHGLVAWHTVCSVWFTSPCRCCAKSKQ